MLTLSHIRKAYGAHVAVDDLSLVIRPGEVFGLLGPNGAGKSTTVSIAVGLLAPDAGTVDIGGRGPPTRPEVRRLLGVAPQSLAIYEELSAEENLRFFARMFGFSGAALRARVEAALALADLQDRRHDLASTFSGGMKRRLNLAAAMVHDPQLLLLDEPTVGVDPQSRNAILERIEAMRAEGRTVIYTTHYMEEAARICDRVAIIDHGKVLAVDTVANLIAAHGGEPLLTVTTADGHEQIRTRDPVGDLARLAAGRTVLDFRLDRADLEQVFLNLTGRTLRD
jgi:ABC-2 type transport system ATP-binding protein